MSAPISFSADDIVASLYRVVLGRDAETSGLRAHVASLETGGLDAKIREFINSAESSAIRNDRDCGFQDLNLSAGMRIDASVGDDGLSALWDHVRGVWSAYGKNDALWSVISEDRFLASNNPNDDLVREFYGNTFDLRYLLAFLQRAGMAPSDFPVLAEYGCGVGRVTKWLAQDFAHIKAFDVSQPHLEAAARHTTSAGLSNIEYILVDDRAALAELRNIDLFYSFIVLQHNPPPIILDILAHAFAGLNENGVALFQVPVFAKDYAFRIGTYWQDVAALKTMEVHFVSQASIFELARQHDMELIEVRPDHGIGNYDRWMSMTFLMQKRSARK